MTALCIVLGILVLLGLIPVGVYAVYDEDLSVSLTVLGFRIRLYPAKKKAKKKSKQAASGKEKEKKSFSMPKRSSLEQYLRLLLELLGRLRRKILIRRLTLHAVFGGTDAADAALNYGKAWAAIGAVMPLLDTCFRIRKRDVGAFQSEDERKLRLYAKACATLTLGQVLALLLHALVRFIKIKKSKEPEKAVQ